MVMMLCDVTENNQLNIIHLCGTIHFEKINIVSQLKLWNIDGSEGIQYIYTYTACLFL